MNMLKFRHKFNRLPIWWRLLVLAIFVGVIVLVWYFAFDKPLARGNLQLRDKISNMEYQINDLRDQIFNMRSSSEEVVRKMEVNPNKAIYEKDLLKAEHKIDALKKLLYRVKNLKLVDLSVNDLRSVTVNGDSGNADLSKHGVKLVLQTDYLSFLDYLYLLQQVEHQIYYDNIDYNVTQYPLAKVVLNIHTLTQKVD